MNNCGALLLFLAFVFCSSNNNISTLESKNLTSHEKIKMLSTFISLKSDVIATEFKIFDVNLNSRSIPGPTNRDFKIILYVDPHNISLWTKNKLLHESTPLDSLRWLSEIVTPTVYNEIRRYPFLISSEKSPGSELSYWINEEHGIILIRYLQQ